MNIPSQHTGHNPRFTALPESNGARIIDPIEDVQFELYTPTAVDPTATTPQAVPFCYPVESAAQITAPKLTTPTLLNVHVRAQDGELLASAANDGPTSVDEAGVYSLELGSTPMKLYLVVESRVLIHPTDTNTELIFPDTDTVYIGARSFHNHPARTLTTTAKPSDLMTVISEFGAALKTLSPERAFPTWRGHPPLIEHGDEVAIPNGSLRPDTGIHIEVPPELRYIYPVTPLVYYLGAKLQPGRTPHLYTEDGFEQGLVSDDGFEAGVARLLKQVFTLDCLTRTEGHYQVQLDERERAKELGIDFDYAALYDAPLAERLATYLSLPYEDVEPVVPQWPLTADMIPETDYVELLPYIASELAIVRCPSTTAEQPRSSTENVEFLEEFCRTDNTEQNESGPDQIVTPWQKSGASLQTTTDGGTTVGVSVDEIVDNGTYVSRDDIFHAVEAPSITQTYIGDGFPLGANKGSKAAYDRRLTIRSNAPSRISVTVICNDAEMLDETAVSDVYGTRDRLEFDITVKKQLSTADLRDVLQDERDFVHYIGHVDARGLQAADGFLDVHTLDDVGMKAFFLNACRSFRQGAALVDRGAVAGLVTLENIHNRFATKAGHTIARLLNEGWSLDGALQLLQEDTIFGRHYMVVGDGLVELVSPDSGVPAIVEIDSSSLNDTYHVTIQVYPRRHRHLGTIYTPYIGDNDRRYIASGEIDTFTVTAEELREFLSLGPIPVRMDGDPTDDRILQWSDELDPSRF